MTSRGLSALALGMAFASVGAGLNAGEKSAWVKVEKAIMGPSRPVALVYAPSVKRWMTLGYIFPPGNGQRKPASYDELAFDPAEEQWENWYPQGKDWGPKFGDARPPAWKGEKYQMKDEDGNVRPNWRGWYWLLGASRNYTWDPDGKQFLFYMDGHTFSYDPVLRTWKDLAAPGDPQSATKSRTLLWGSICYDEANKRVVLFGGGNALTKRGDPGTWTYTPATNTWTQLKLDVQPPPRANSSLVYDPVNKNVVLFGGDQLDKLIADTWVFDGKQWEQRRPAVSPTPRAGHALLWLPRSQKILLLGGYGYTSSTEYVAAIDRSLPFEAWTYDVKADRWELVQREEPVKKPAVANGPISPNNYNLLAAVDADDNLAVIDARRTFWKGNAAAFAPDAAGTQQFGAKSGAVERRTGPYDPAWYQEGIPAADPAQVAAELKALPANRWHLRPTPKRPGPNTDWGSAVLATDSDQIIRFSGGHSAYSGTAPHIYDIKTDRWSLPFAPEMPIDFCYSNDGVPGEWSFGGNPWMTGHTYKATGYDPKLKSLVFGPHRHSFFFDPKVGTWSRAPQPNPYRPDFYTVTLIPTVHGLVSWAHGSGGGLWQLDPKDRTWQPLPVRGKLPGPVCDNAGMAYDSKRDRLLTFAFDGKGGTSLHAYRFDICEAKPLTATGAGQVQGIYRRLAGDKQHFEFREAVYVAELDMVMIGATGLFYDCAKNAWLHAALPSDAPDLAKHPSYNLGVMYDARRNLVWAVDTNCRVFVLRLDRATLKLEPVS